MTLRKNARKLGQIFRLSGLVSEQFRMKNFERFNQFMVGLSCSIDFARIPGWVGNPELIA